ncbi:MAG: hypothetical protein ACOCUU_02130 [Nanoarchaeota archaeon]
MAQETILQHWIISQFALPFLLIFFIVFAILKKTKILGEESEQLNALVAFVIGLIFVGAVFPKMVVENMILFLTIAMVVSFVGLLLWGFVSGGDLKGGDGGFLNDKIKWIMGIAVLIAVVIALLWATGVNTGGVLEKLFDSDWSQTFWTNVLFIIVIAAALAIGLIKGKK